MSANDLARQLEEIGYVHLFNELDNAQQQKIWSIPGVERELRSLVGNAESPPTSRFLAAELLASRSAPSARVPKQDLARVYVEGLKQGASQVANPWGLPGELGPLSQRVLSLGTAAEAPLRSALDNTLPLLYMGSKESTVGNAYRWRVKDQAAELLTALLGQRFNPDPDPKKRDKAIEALQANAAGDGDT
jgi:hypothetical protein